MHPFWKSNFGKLLIGSCGTQVGMLFSLGGLVLLTLFCGVCASLNIFTISLSQVVAGPVNSPAAPAIQPELAPPPENLDMLLQRVSFLVSRVDAVRSNAQNPPAAPMPPPPTPVPPPAVAIAIKNAANLRSGPAESYNRIGQLPVGERLEIVGRNNDNTWWLVASPDGQFAWVSNMAVTTVNVSEALPVVSIPALLTQALGRGLPETVLPVTGGNSAAGAPDSVPTAGELAPSPLGTPIPGAEVSRRFVQDTLGYKQLVRRLLLPTVSESFSPDGSQIAVTEKITLYTITVDGATTRTLVGNDPALTLVGGAVWSPDGQYLAFVADRLADCAGPCRTVGLVRIADGAVSFLQAPPDSGLDKPRWTLDGRLLVTSYLAELANGATFVYDTSGQGQAASGSYRLSSSPDGQKWSPWLPGKTWEANGAGDPDGYYGD